MNKNTHEMIPTKRVFAELEAAERNLASDALELLTIISYTGEDSTYDAEEIVEVCSVSARELLEHLNRARWNMQAVRDVAIKHEDEEPIAAE